ncbi:hypothetical protein [Gordonia sp. VNK21]|uniref:hypothetical protein n=1 Tax=Gordonia sp. VNK21 TaxID=3382483 RepID=UPI0038D4FA31
MTVAALRRKLAGLSAGPGAAPAVLPVPEPIAGLLPRRGLAPGSVVEVSGAASMPAALLAAVSATGATAALVGLPQLNLAVAADLGAQLDRIAVVDEPGVDRLEVASVLLDGIDLVLVAVDSVTPSRARVLTGRARRQSSTLMVVGPPGCWPGATVRIEAEVSGYRHVPARRSGYGRIGGLEMDVRIGGAGLAPRSTRCALTENDRLVAVAAAGQPAVRLAVAN